jgi:Na+-transporting NADH:ubiquinone oxidoreductase subunit NqrF
MIKMNIDETKLDFNFDPLKYKFVYNNSQFKVLTKNKDDAVRDFMTWCGDTTHYKNVFDETKDCIAPFRGDIPNMKIFLDLHTRDNYDKYTGYLFKSVIIKNNIKEYKFHLF